MSKRKSSYSELQDSDSDDSSSDGQHEKRIKSEQYEQDDGCLCSHTPAIKGEARQNELKSNVDSDPTSSSAVVEVDAIVPTYCYKPLDHNQIRVLQLLPGKFGTPLKAELRTCHLLEERAQTDASGAPNEIDNDGYEALSYVWGPSVFDHAIEISGSALLGITRSLYDALQHLRYLEQSRRIWADAVCINQRDDDEKSRQVTRMMEIYRQAQNVVVWLGPSAPDDELAFLTIEAVQDMSCVYTAFVEMVKQLGDPRLQSQDLTCSPRYMEGMCNQHFDEGTPGYMVRLQRIWSEWKSIFDHTGRINMKDESSPSQQARSAILSAIYQCQRDIFEFYADRITESAPGLLAASALFARPWWSRLWVIQEVASRDDYEQVRIVSGFFLVSFSKFGSAMGLLQDLLRDGAVEWRAQNECTLRHFNERIDVLSEVFPEGHDGHHTGLSKIVQLGSWKCSISHDRIYAMYGLLSLKDCPMLSVDYSRGLGELFHAFSLAALIEGNAMSGDWSQSVTMTSGRCKGTSTEIYSLLAMVGTESQPSALDSLPSWVPNFDRLSASSMMKFAVHGAERSGEWDDASQWKPEHPFHGQPTFDYPFQNTMRLQGRVFARIEEVLYGSEWPKFVLATSTAESHALRVFGWYTRCMAFVERALAAAISPHCLLQDGTPIDVSADDDQYDHLAMLYENILDDQDKKEYIYLREVDVDFMTTIHLATFALSRESKFSNFMDPNRNLCSLVTSAGDRGIGWVPMSARQVDGFCVLRSCRYPFLIRPAESGRHRLVGDAWTLETSLKEALGGLHGCPDPVECRKQDDLKVSCNSWDSKDPEMVDLIANLGEIVLE